MIQELDRLAGLRPPARRGLQRGPTERAYREGHACELCKVQQSYKKNRLQKATLILAKTPKIANAVCVGVAGNARGNKRMSGVLNRSSGPNSLGGPISLGRPNSLRSP